MQDPTNANSSAMTPLAGEARRLPHRRVERAFQVALVLFTTAFLLWLYFKPNGATGLTWFSDMTLSVTAVLGGILALALAFKMRGPDRRSWLLIGAGVFSWGIGQVIWSYYELILQQDTPFPSPSDAGYLGMIPLMLLGLLTLPSGAIEKEERIKIGLDAMIIMASVATVSWFVVLGPVYSQADTTWAQKFIGLAYPAGDVILMCALVGGLLRGWINRRNPVLIPLVAGIVAFVIADFGFAFLTVHDDYASGSPIDIGWPLGFLLVSYATTVRWSRGATVSEAHHEATDEATWHAKVRTGVPYALVLGVIALVYASRFGERGTQWNIFLAAALATVLLVVARQVATLAENDRLNTKLRAFSQDLEAMVRERTERLAMLHGLASSLGAAASSEEVIRIGLNAFANTTSGHSAGFFAMTDRGLVFAGSWPADTDPSVFGTPPAEVRATQKPQLLTTAGLRGDDLTTWMLVTERGEMVGFVAIAGAGSTPADARETLATIGAEFGIAFENQRRYEEARELADRDPMTGLFNPRYFHTALDALMESRRKSEASLGLVIGDIDDFKLFNDTYGHPAGDDVLKKVAAGLTELCSEESFAARFGGDEFAVVLPGATRDETISFIRDIQAWAQEQAFQEDGGERIPIRLSFGFAVAPAQGTKRYELVGAADGSLYEAKRSGSGVTTKERDERQDALRKTGSFTFLEALVTSVDNKDQYTKRHCDLVAEYALVVADGLGLSPEVQRSLAIAGALHDVGKICIPDRILRKPGGLTADEYETIKLHVPLAANLIQHVPNRKDVLDGVLNHHERFDGTGYPRGVSGGAIPLLGRIMGVVDAFSAMTLDRPYRKALPFSHAFEELRKGAGTQFDPEIVDVFIRQMERQITHPSEQAA